MLTCITLLAATVFQVSPRHAYQGLAFITGTRCHSGHSSRIRMEQDFARELDCHPDRRTDRELMLAGGR
jgi:hypothetical protein